MKNEKKLLELARELFAEAEEGSSEIREQMREDIDIFDGDGIWPERLRAAREGDPKGARPCLVVSDLSARVHQVTNDFRQNRPSIKIRPVDDNADVDTAKVFNGTIRHIEQQSDADIAYETANFYQTVGGLGYFRMTEEMYEGKNELFIKPVANPMSVYMDPFAMDPTGCDARYCFVAEDVPRKVFEREYPKVSLASEGWGDGDTENAWVREDAVRVAEWFNIEEKSAGNLIDTDDGEMSEDEYWQKAQETGVQPAFRSAKVEKRKVCMWRKLVGNKVLKEVELPICYVPVFRMAGENYFNESTRVFKGLVRDSRDAVRMVSYMFSTYVEAVALQPKAPFIGAAGQFDGFEAQWGAANQENLAYLEYNNLDINGKDVPAPQRSQPPLASQGIMQGLVLAQNALKDTSGLGAASLGQKGNETSGKAILARQREGDVSTFHLMDNAAKAIRQAGRVAVMWIPKVYNEITVARIIGEDGEADHAYIDPNQKESLRKVPMQDGSIRSIYNLGVGRYDVVSSVGPSYTTKRVEQAEMMNQLFQSFPQSFSVLGDIFMENQDGPGTDRMAQRLKALLPPQVAQAEQDEGTPIPPKIKAKMQQLQQQLEQGKQLVQDLAQQNEQLTMQLKSKEGETQARIYAANEDTERTKISAVKDIQIAGMNNDSREAIAGLQQQLSEQQQQFQQMQAFMQNLMQIQQTEHQQGLDLGNADRAAQAQDFSQQQALQAQQTPPSGV